MTNLKSDIVGRVKRLSLPPSERSALMPLYEAVQNGLQAIDERHKGWAKRRGKLLIDILRSEQNYSEIVGFVVTDNGTGLNEDNYEAFITPDTERKINKGGKGIGRLYWLKVFDVIKVESNFESDTKRILYRSFDFQLGKSNQIRNEKTRASTSGFMPVGTRITLSKYVPPYNNRAPGDVKQLSTRLVSHFLPALASNTAPLIELKDGVETIDLRRRFSEAIVKQETETVEITVEDGEVVTLTIQHLRCKKEIKAPGSHYNWLFLCADDRCVEDVCIDTPLGIKQLENEEVYFGCISSDFLNQHVNQERTYFTFTNEAGQLIRRKLIEAARLFLAKDLTKIVQEKVQNSHQVISEFPQLAYLKPTIEQFVKTLPASCTKSEDIYLEMCRNRRRRIKKNDRLADEIIKVEEISEQLQEQVDEFQSFVQSEQTGALAEYVMRRRAVLTLLEKLQKLDVKGESRKQIEEAIHTLICPMRVDSSSLSLGQHNLWVVDDVLAFASFFASDKRFDSFTSIDSADRPDITFFYNSCGAFENGVKHYHKVVLVEFKRPGRDDYRRQDNPIEQVKEYIAKLQNNTAVDINGTLLTGINRNTQFYCYIIADLTPTLEREIAPYQFMDTPDMTGKFAHLRNPDFYAEIIQYRHLIDNANARNKVFFEKLGLA